jgi:diacylglycerol O-acyltransferase
LEQLKGLDSLFIHHETKNAPLHVLAVMEVDRTNARHPVTAETFRHLVSARISSFDALCKKIAVPPLPVATPLWLRTKPDLRIHIREITLGIDSRFDNFQKFIADYMSIPLDRSRPLWEFIIVHDFEGNISRLVAKGHHALLDGIAGFELMASIFDLSEDGADLDLSSGNSKIDIENEEPDWTTHFGASMIVQPLEWASSSINIAKKFLNIAKIAVDQKQRHIFTFPWRAPYWPKNRKLSSNRTISKAVLYRDDIKYIRQFFNVSFHDVIGAIVSRSLKNIMIENDDFPDAPLVVVSPVSVRRKRSAGGNELSVMFAQMPTHLNDIDEEFAFMSKSFKNAKEQLSEIGTATLGEVSKIAPWTALGKLWSLYSKSQVSDKHAPFANIMLSTLPGPSFAMYCAGTKVESATPYGPIFDGSLLNITAISYLDKVNLGIVACPDNFKEVNVLATEIENVCSEVLDYIKMKNGQE